MVCPRLYGPNIVMNVCVGRAHPLAVNLKAQDCFTAGSAAGGSVFLGLAFWVLVC